MFFSISSKLNVSRSCPVSMETWFTILGWTLSIVAEAGNGSIIFLVCSKRRLLTKTNAFIISLAVADLGVGASVFPSEFSSEIGKTSHNSSSRCKNQQSMGNTMAVRLRICDKLVQFSSGSLRGDCYAFKVSKFYEPRSCYPNDFCFLGNPCGICHNFIFLTQAEFCYHICHVLGDFFMLLSNILLFLYDTCRTVYKHDRSSATLAKQLRFNHRGLTVSSQDRSAVTMMAIVIVVFLVCYGIYLRCSLVALFHNLRCNDIVYKIPMLVLNSAINPWVYAFFKRDIKKEMIKKLICRKTCGKKLQNQ